MSRSFAKKSIAVTHDGSFHADDVFACATLSLLLKDRVKIIRTRDEEVIEKADFVVDVGNIYDPDKNRFDHHQPQGAGERPAPSRVEGENGIPYASFGLVWEKFGKELCGSQEVAETIDQKLVQPIDAIDNGVLISKNLMEGVSDYTIENVFDAFLPTWKESERAERTVNGQFLVVLDLAKRILKREILHEKHRKKSDAIVEKKYQETKDKRLIVLKRCLPWKRVLVEHPEPLFAVTPREEDKWQAEAVPIVGEKFKKRKYFPRDWAGLRNGEMARVSGVPDAIFCHKDLFLCVAKSREGAINLAKIALQD